MRLFAILALSLSLAVGNARAEGLIEGPIDCYKAQGAQEAGDPALAIVYYTRCIAWGGQTRENLAITYNNRGIAYTDQAKYDRAIQDYYEAIRLSPRYAHAYYNRGLAHFEQGGHDLALQDYGEAVRLNPIYAAHPYAEILTTRKPETKPSTPSAPPTTQALEIAPAGLSETGHKSFAIHLASVRTKDGAESGWKDLQRQFPELIGQRDLIIRSVEIEAQGTFFRIMTGPFEARSRAQDLCEAFKTREQYCTVLRLADAR